ncbi:MAG: 4Fe-4S binding protein [Cyanobacteria bacterium]|nr:4Fe-4S binding protein [Cyanobacteriota bacterium]
MLRIPLNPLKYPFHSLRPYIIYPVVWVVFFGTPLFDWFRLDMLNQKLIWLGHTYPMEPQNLMWLPIGFYGMVLLIGIISVFWGRLFCGWSCPHNVMTEWTRPLRALVGREPPARWLKTLTNQLINHWPSARWILWLTSITLGTLLAFVMTFSLTAYVLPPSWVFQSYLTGNVHPALGFGQGLFTVIGLFLLYSGHDFCRAACPYGMAQGLSAYLEGKWRPMEIRFTGNDIAADCKTCKTCVTACPVDIDPRKPENLKLGEFYGCFNCGECIDACNFIHAPKQKPGILEFYRESIF